jgi:cell fate regulator YaaT (PSP1 superfamily)
MTEEQLTYLTSSKIDTEALLDDFPDYDFPPGKTLMDVVGVKLHDSGPVILFNCQDMYLDQGDKVVVETGRGLALGEVVVPARRRTMSENGLSRVIRKASSNDKRQHTRNIDKENAAYHMCKDRIDSLKLPMKLVKVEYLHGGNKAIFYFSAEGRIDFRELVRELARRLHTRIEMRQIGVRDASRMLGGIGACGIQLCCSTYLREFKPVSIRMAKEQNLVLNPQKVSGVCGRLLCCLTYEDKTYRDASKNMPKMGRRVVTPDGHGRVRDRDVLKRRVRVQLDEENTIREYTVDELQLDTSEKPGRQQPDSRSDDRSSKKRSNDRSSR